MKGMQCAGWLVFLSAGFLVSGCNGGDGEDVVDKSSFQMPIKENTWVRKEKVRKTKNDFFSSALLRSERYFPLDKLFDTTQH